MLSLTETIDKIISNSFRDIPVFNPNGNLTSDGTNTYTYDVENRLIAVEHPGSSIEYQYDPFGRRISKTVDGVTAYFIYDGDQVIEERDAANQLIASYVYGSGIDEVLTMTRNGETYYYFYDGLGSVTDITDTSGAVVESYSYDVYGQPSQLSTIGNPYYFTGRRFDDETGLYYYRARYYSPSIGRFLQRDLYTWGPDDPRILSLFSFNDEAFSMLLGSFSNSTGINQPLLTYPVHNYFQLIISTGLNNPQYLHSYLYVLNNPINLIDPLGLCGKKIDPADLNDDGKIDNWDWWLWFWGRRLWGLITPPGMPNPPGYGDEGPGTNDPLIDPDRRKYMGI